MVVTRSQVKLTQESEQPPPETASADQPQVSTSALARSDRGARTHSISHTSRSSAAIAARKAAAEAEHMRRVAQLEIVEMEAEAKLRARRAELERKTAEIEYQAELAAIEADSRHGSRSGRSHGSVEQWVESVVPSMKSPSDPNLGLPTKSGCEAEPSNLVLCPQDFVPTSKSIAAHSPAQLPQHDFSRGDGGTAATDTRGENLIGVTQLIEALRTLTTNNGSKNNKHFLKLPTFDGKSPLDWLLFKRAFLDTGGAYTDAENLARLNQAIKGAAREAVSMLLVMAPHADVIMEALDRHFGRPEQIVMKEVSAIRALPKLGQEVSGLISFATRVRNCVAVTKLLHHTDYLRSPELFGALLSKLTPLLRARWLDFAASHEWENQARVELLSDFLNREVDLMMKFGAVFDNLASDSSSAAPQRQRAHAVSESAPALPIPKKSSIVNKSSCLFCKKFDHQLDSCQNFSSLTADDRWSFIKENKVCHRCLQKGSHNYKFCNKNKTLCSISGCNLKHHTLLHNNNFVSSKHSVKEVSPDPTISDANNDHVLLASNNTRQTSSLSPLLKVVAVKISGPAGCIDTFALLDDGSTATFIDAEIASQIGAVGPEGSFHLDCVGGLSREGTVQHVDFEIQGRSETQKFQIRNAKSIKNLGLLSQSVARGSLASYPHLSDLADNLCYEEAKPTILIGIDNWHLITASELRQGSRSQPVAIRTPLGWVVFGFISSRTRLVETTYHLSLREHNKTMYDLELLIRNQYKLDALGITKYEPRSSDDQRAINILESSTRRLPNGHFQVGLLWKNENFVVPKSYPLALSRFKTLEIKMSKDKEYSKRYCQQIQDMISKGYAEDCTGKAPLGVCWYLPHFGVINQHKPGKVRVVHDAAAKVQGVSLNSMLLSGPDLLQPLLGILMRFRENRIALTADIKEMFPQVKIQECDRDAQRFLWRDSPDEPMRTYRMSSMIFGACSSPSTAIYIVNRNASEFQEEFPDAANAIRSDTYMDDYIGSVNLPIKDAARLVAEIVEIHKRGGFEMRGWVSNKLEALHSLPPQLLSDLSLSNSSVDLGSLESSVTRTLGLVWQPYRDVIGFNSELKEYSPDHFTKREVLSQVMRIYDPLGILAPIVVRGRILFQNLWRKNLDWDEQLSQSDQETWLEWFESLKIIPELKIERCYNMGSYTDLELHVFCDASELAHAAVAYWRFVLPNGDVKLALIASKARVSPLKPVSIPRLELQGAVIAARLATKICDSHRFKPSRRVFWCDSMTVIGWLRSDARNYKPFVAHRIGEILETTKVNDWHWIPTDLNVADDATRGKAAIETRWLSGPEFLLFHPAEWPSEPTVSESTTLGQEELKSTLSSSVHYTGSCQLPLPVVANITHFSSWTRLVRATARAHRFIALIFKNRGHNFQNFWVRDICLASNAIEHNSRSTTASATAPAPLDSEDIVRAERHILGQSQLNVFGEELRCLTRGQPIPKKSRLNILSPVLKDGLLHLAGRTSAVVDKLPIILDGKEPATRLIIQHYHAKFAHANAETVINELRQEYWILGLRNAVRSVVHKCQLCKLLKGRTLQPLMGDLPDERLAHHRRAFTYTGLDYFGPVMVSIGRRREKRWIALFTCLVTRAIHLEIVASLSADSSIMCLRRFIARRGTPSEIFSDNGTSFVGANRQLKALYDAAVPQFAADQKIAWRFIPPSAPFMGGAWERLIRSVKTALRVTLRERAPREEVLVTLLAEAEAIVNARPLTHVSPDENYPEALTPNHFLLGDSSGTNRQFPAEDLSDAALSGRSSWRKALRLSDHFWRRWVSEYLPTLAPRRVPGTEVEIKVGDPVLIGDGDLPRGTWPRGLVEALYPGRDGVIRVVDIRTSGGVLRRPVKKIVLL